MTHVILRVARSSHHPTSTYPSPRDSKTNEGHRQRRIQTCRQSEHSLVPRNKGKHTDSGKSGTSAHHENLTSPEDCVCHYDGDLDESANVYQATTTQLILEAMTEKKLWVTTTKKTTCFLHVLLWTMLFTRQPNWTQLLFSLIHGTTISIPKQVQGSVGPLPCPPAPPGDAQEVSWV